MGGIERMGVLLVLLVLATPAAALLINNGVDGEPQVECGPTHVKINVNTINPFEGHVFVKPLFVTKVDRAYKVQCFYMEADKTVEAEQLLDVSPHSEALSFNHDDLSHLPTQLVTQGVPMPVCRYEVLEEGASGRPIVFAEVGQQVYHKWTCDSETVDTFCMVVRDCFVDDKQGAKVDLINSFGCAEDRFLLSNIEYTSDLTAGVQTHVFKYADRPQLAFQCQISIFVKEPKEACPRPYCSEPGGRGAGSENMEAGPPPSAPDHPFPLGPNSPYLPKEGESENAIRLANPIPLPIDRNAQKNAGYAADASPPAPPPANSPLRQTEYAAEPPPAPTVAGYYGYGEPRSASHSSTAHPLSDGWTAYEFARASLRSRLYNQYRSRRSVDPQEAGVLDVRTELNTLEVEETMEELPASLAHPHRGVSFSTGRVCVSTPAVGVFLGAGAVVLLAAVGFMANAVLRSPKA